MSAPAPGTAAQITEQLPGGGVAILDVIAEPTPRERAEWAAMYARLLRPRPEEQPQPANPPAQDRRAGQ